jgi:hypothetical protein
MKKPKKHTREYDELKRREIRQRKERDKKLANSKHYDREPNCNATGEF